MIWRFLTWVHPQQRWAFSRLVHLFILACFSVSTLCIIHLSMFSPTQGRAGIPTGIWHFHIFRVNCPYCCAQLCGQIPHPWVWAVVNVFEQTKALLFNAHFIAVISPVEKWTWNIMLWFGFNRNYEMLTLEIHVQVDFDLCVINIK